MSYVAGHVSTLSKHPALFPAGVPQSLSHAYESRVFDAATNAEYIDWIAGLLSVMLGHGNPIVNKAVREHLATGGPSWSLKHSLEDEVAWQLIRTLFPENPAKWQLRWLKTGSEACSAAVRIARAVTEKEPVISIGYHGWHDSLLATPPAWGTINQNHVYSYHYGADLSSVADCAAVIIEPETSVPPAQGYLEGLRERCTKAGALLIFDECITGGRYPEYTAARHYGVEPDLIVLSKSLANGWPLACVIGKTNVMSCFDLDYRNQGPVYVSGTYSGETASLAAAKATLEVWKAEKVGEKLGKKGATLRRSLQDQIDANGLQEHVKITGPAYRLILDTNGDLTVKHLLMQELLKQGVLIGAGWNMMHAHGWDDLAVTENAWEFACRTLRQQLDAGELKIDGPLIRQAYRQA